MLKLTEKIRETKTFSQAEFDAFARLSGDNNPIHVDPEFSARTRFGRTVAHGMLLYSIICGVISRHFPGATQLSQQLKFPSPTYANELMTISIQVVGQDERPKQLRLLTEMKNPAGMVTVTGETVILL